MKKKSKLNRINFLILILFLSGISVYAQDVITLKNGDEIKAKVTEISSSEIRYKRFENLEGPTVIVAKSDVFAINYENGTREVINAAVQKTAPAKNAVTEMSDIELKQKMALNAPYLHDKYTTATTLKRFGVGLTLGGLAATIIGVAVADKDVVKENGVTTTYLSGPGAGVFTVGMVSICVGTPLWIVGGVKRKKTRNAYLQEFGYGFQAPVQPSPYLQLTAAPNRIGLALVF